LAGWQLLGSFSSWAPVLQVQLLIPQREEGEVTRLKNKKMRLLIYRMYIHKLQQHSTAPLAPDNCGSSECGRYPPPAGLYQKHNNSRELRRKAKWSLASGVCRGQ
jgi:hypothetical protein